MSPPRRLLLLTGLSGVSVLAMLALAWAGAAPAEKKPDGKPGVKLDQKPDQKPADDAEPAESKVIVRVYNIRDLIAGQRVYRLNSQVMPPTRDANESEAFEGPSEGATGGGGLFQGNYAPDPSFAAPRAAASRIVDILWHTAATPGAADSEKPIRFLVHDGLLIVRETEAAHRAVAERLGQLRSVGRPTLSVVARWVLLPRGELERFVVATPVAGGFALTVDVPGLLTAHPRAVQHQGWLTGQSGRPMYVLSGRARTWMVNVKSNVGGGVGVGIDPIVRTTQDGASLEVLPTLLPEGGTVLLEVETALSEWREIKPARYAAVAPPGLKGEVPVMGDTLAIEPVDRIDLPIQQLRTAVVAPLNRAVLVGGMTVEPRLTGEADSRVSFLLLEVRTGPVRP